MQLIKISSADVEANPSSYNSTFHTALEFPSLVAPSELPTFYSRFLALICHFQDIPPTAVQTLALTPSQSRLLLDASKASLHTGEPNRLLVEELETEIHPLLSTLKLPPQGLFVRLDDCSPKDGVRGISPLQTVEQIILRITTSHRATNCITRALENGNEGVKLFFMPFNPDMNTANEYRVFCPPPPCGIAAISQYKWHKASPFASLPTDTLEQIARRIEEEVRRIHQEILETVELRKGKEGDETDELLLKQGFSFDVMWDGGGDVDGKGRCKLIEPNTFGARSGCGCCLFHWVKDVDVLYGRKEGEFIIAV